MAREQHNEGQVEERRDSMTLDAGQILLIHFMGSIWGGLLLFVGYEFGRKSRGGNSDNG
jgi:hypothetical protein